MRFTILSGMPLSIIIFFRKGSSLVAAFTCSTLYILLAAIWYQACRMILKRSCSNAKSSMVLDSSIWRWEDLTIFDMPIVPFLLYTIKSFILGMKNNGTINLFPLCSLQHKCILEGYNFLSLSSSMKRLPSHDNTRFS